MNLDTSIRPWFKHSKTQCGQENYHKVGRTFCGLALWMSALSAAQAAACNLSADSFLSTQAQLEISGRSDSSAMKVSCVSPAIQKRVNSILKSSPREAKKFVPTALSLMHWSQPVSRGSTLSIQTGKYGAITLPPHGSAPCLKTVFHSASELEREFPEFNFSVDGKIRNCQALFDGIKVLMANKTRVRQNIMSFHSPLHTIYLTDTTKFNHNVIGEMGLYINVNKAGELQRRLIDFKIGRDDILQERRRTSTSAL